MTSKIEIVEVGPRDGLQNEDVLLTTDQKLNLIDHLIASGVTRIEAVSFAHPKYVPQMADGLCGRTNSQSLFNRLSSYTPANEGRA